MKDPDRSLKHQSRDLLLFGGRHRGFRALCSHGPGLILRAGLVHCALAQAAQVPAHPDHAI
jgi:hypothetical protein